MATASEIDTYHQRLVSTLNVENVLGQKAAIRSGKDQKWEDEKFEGLVDFELYPKDARLIADSERKRAVPLFAFEKIRIVGKELEEVTDKRSGPKCWVSWHEQWERFAPDGVNPGKKGTPPYFMLGAIQWILFWGQASDDSKVQVLRAEWDNAAYLAPHRKRVTGKDEGDEGASLAGQPHWHVDPLLELGDFSTVELFRGTELEEEAGHSFSGKYLKIHRVHLAMSGWSNPPPPVAPSVGGGIAGAKAAPKAGKVPPELYASRWQVGYSENKERLIEWNLCVLRYIKSQINYISEH